MAENRYALVVANSIYSDKALRTLKAPEFDAKALAQVLQSPEIGMFDLATLTNKDSHVVQQTIERFFANRSIDDTLLLYFSGHGVKDDSGSLYLAARNTESALLRSTGIPDAFIRDVMKGSRARRQVLILDCCFGGAFARGLLTKGEAAKVGVNELFQGQGRVILTASTDMEFALEADGVTGEPPSSVFTSTLVLGLKTGEADMDRDGRISVQDLYNYAYKRIALPGSRQTPTISSVGQEGEIILATVSGAAAARTSPQAFASAGAPVARRLDLKPWVTIRDQGPEGSNPAVAAVTALETFLSVRGGATKLSPRYLYQKAKQLDGEKYSSDVGVRMETLVRVLEEFGCVPEEVWPYVPGRPQLPKGLTWTQLDKQAAGYRARLIAVTGINEIPIHLGQGRPLLALFRVHRTGWYETDAAEQGLISRPVDNARGELIGSVAVTIVDYDETQKIIRFAHTWGSAWGKAGFGEMTLDTAREILEGDQMWAVETRAKASFSWSDGQDFVPRPATTDAPATEETARVPEKPVPGRRASRSRHAGEPRPDVRDTPRRVVYDARHRQGDWSSEKLPASAVVRAEGAAPTGDPPVDVTYDALGSFFGFFKEVFKRNSWDGMGGPLEAVVRFGRDFDNAFWDGRRVIIGDGKIFKSFYRLDIIAKECGMGLLQSEAKLVYQGQSGALFQSLGLVLASMVKQYVAHQTVEQADWLIGDGLIEGGRGLVSLEHPGTGYDNPVLGKDPQVDHMSRYQKIDADNGGVHINCGIPNRAFVLAAQALGGSAWEGAGKVWYNVVCQTKLPPKATFAQFAQRTIAEAGKTFDKKTAGQIADAWSSVGVKVAR